MKNKGQNSNREIEFTVVLEGLRSDFRIFGEGLSALREKVDALWEKVETLEIKVDTLQVKVDTLQAKVNGIFEMTGRNTEDIASIKIDLKAFSKRITLLEQNYLNN